MATDTVFGTLVVWPEVTSMLWLEVAPPCVHGAGNALSDEFGSIDATVDASYDGAFAATVL